MGASAACALWPGKCDVWSCWSEGEIYQNAKEAILLDTRAKNLGVYIYIYMSVYIHTCAYNISDQCVWYTKYILILYLQISVCTWYIYIFIYMYIIYIYISCTYIYIYVVCVCVYDVHTHTYTHIYMHIYFVAGCGHFDCLVLVQNYYHSCSIPAWDSMEDPWRSMVIFRELLW